MFAPRRKLEKPITCYQIARARLLAVLENEVNLSIMKGYVPIGAPFIDDTDKHNPVHAQAMVHRSIL